MQCVLTNYKADLLSLSIVRVTECGQVQVRQPVLKVQVECGEWVEGYGTQWESNGKISDAEETLVFNTTPHHLNASLYQAASQGTAAFSAWT
jgi:hypothetical protein